MGHLWHDVTFLCRYYVLRTFSVQSILQIAGVGSGLGAFMTWEVLDG